MSHFGYWLTHWISSVFDSKRRKWSGCTDRWLSNWTWLNPNKHTVASWNLSCEICTWLSSYMSQPVVWTSQCKAISLSVPPPTHPTPVSFPPYPNKSCFSGKSAQPLMFLHKAKTVLTSRLWSSACLFTNYRAQDVWFVQNNPFKRKCTQLGSHKHASQNFHKNQQEMKLYFALAEPKGQHSSPPPSFDLALR